MMHQLPTQDVSSSPLFRVWLCGPFQVERWNGSAYEPLSLKAWGGSNDPRRLLKRLLCSPRRQVRRGELLEDLWPEVDPDVSRGYLNDAVYRLRGALSPAKGAKSLLITADDHSSLVVPGQEMLWVDADAALDVLTQAEAVERESGDPVSLLQEAAQLLERGQFLEEEEGLWAHGRRATVERTRHGCLLWQARLSQQRGSLRQAETLLNALLEQDAMDEDALCLLMTNLHLQHRTSEALHLFEQTAHLFHEEGLELATSTKEVIGRVRNGSLPSTERILKNSPFASPVGDSDIHAVSTLDITESMQIKRVNMPDITTNDTMSRREASKKIVTFVAGLLTAPYLFDLMHVGTLLHDEEILSICAPSIPIFWRLFFDGQLSEVERVLPAYISHLTTLAQQPSKYQKQAASLASQAHQLGSLITLEHEDFGTSLTHCKQAFFYGQMADDHNLQAASLIRQANVLYYRKRYTLQTLQEAEHYASGASPLIRGRVYSDLAASYARYERKQEADHYRGLSHDTIPDRPEDDPGFLYTYTNHYILYLHDALCYLHFNQPDDALKAITKAATFVPHTLSPRRIELLNHQLSVTIAQGDLDLSRVSLEAAIELGRTLGSALYLTATHEIYQLQMLTKWPYEQRVKVLADLFH